MHSIREPRKYACGLGPTTTKGDAKKAIKEMGEKVKVKNVHWFTHQGMCLSLVASVRLSVAVFIQGVNASGHQWPIRSAKI